MNKKRLFFTFLLTLSLAGARAQSAQSDGVPFRDEALGLHERVTDLPSHLSVDEKISLLYASSPGIPRLQISKYYHGNEALHGVVRPGPFTVFPQVIGLANIWYPDLHRRIAAAISYNRKNEIAKFQKRDLKIANRRLEKRNRIFHTHADT